MYKWVFVAACTILLLISVSPLVSADSFAGLNLFGFPATGSSGSDLTGMISSNGMLSASTASFSPSNQFTGYFGSGLNGVQLGVGFGYPVASHDASNLAFARSIAFESSSGNDAVAFPDLDASLNSAWSSFPTISSTNADIKYMENTQLQLTTVSDTMPMPITGFNFPSGFFNGFFL